MKKVKFKVAMSMIMAVVAGFVLVVVSKMKKVP